MAPRAQTRTEGARGSPLTPPTDDEYLATARHAMMALEAQLYRSLGLPSPSHDQALSIVLQMRDLVARAIADLGVKGAEEIVDWYERAAKRVVRDLGTSAWEEPETAPGSDRRPRTESELTNLRDYFAGLPDTEPLRETTAAEVVRVIDEVRCLRFSLDEIATGNLGAAQAIDVARKARAGEVLTGGERPVTRDEIRRLRSDASVLVRAARCGQ